MTIHTRDHLSSFNKRKLWIKKTNRGYTIVELSIAVAIAGVLLVSAIGLVQTVLTTQRANNTTTLLSRAITQVDKIWSKHPDYSGLSVSSAGAAGVFEGLPVTTDASSGLITAVTSQFNRPVYIGVTPNIPATGLNRGFAITFAGLPKSICADLVSAGASAGIRGIAITPENTIGTTTTAVTGFTMDAAGVISAPSGSVMALNGTETAINIANVTGANGCSTSKGSVALTFVNWK